ncbi:MAG: aminomethyltransferase family protein [Burkholderiales bacterium]|nr:aminomethyltransferase family protein [Burkholderiales bacterium]
MSASPGPAAVPDATELRVPGGACRVITLQAGDVLSIVDVEGGQGAWLFALSAAGDGAAALGRVPQGRGTLPAICAACGFEPLSDPRCVGRDLLAAGAIALSGAQQLPGEVLQAQVAEPLLCIVAIPPQTPSIESPVRATDYAIRIVRRAAAVVRVEAPAPLAPPRLDFRIAHGTAQAYRVAAGEWIQVVDIEGRECSDFLAFDAWQLEQGVEVGLDATVTRTLTGRSYPGPGLASKFFDARMRPMLEVVQDTCGRHDTFALACTARYYDDMGYPGHANCSENFNQVLAPFGIASRPGWPAINFFYNTTVADDRIGLDEPWSRPGDYVLMRALSDLVCASSACPDDIDPANGWNPTDIQVRVYPAEHHFPRAIAMRVTPDSPPVLTQQTAFHARTAPLSRRMTEYRGYWLPASYASEGAIAEYWACREKVAAVDLSPLRKFEVLGPDAEALLDFAVTRDITRLAVGQVVYTAVCHPHGGMLDDATVFRLGPHNFRFVCGDPYCGLWLRRLAEEKGFRAWVRSSTDQLHNLSVQGPRSRELLDGMLFTAPTQPSIGELKWFRFAIARVGGPTGPAVVVSRTGYTGELGYEIWCHPKDATPIWDTVFAAGAPLGIAPLGLEALDLLRIEAGLVFAGYEFCDQTDPFEAGIGFTVPLATKRADFVGREALQRRAAHPQRRLVGLAVEGRDVPVHGDPVCAGRAQIGVVTSGMHSPILNRTIALARVDIVHVEPGTALEIGKLDGHQKRLDCTVEPFPHYDPDKKRVRA